MNFKKASCLVFMFFESKSIWSQLKLPPIFSDHTILQQQTDVSVLGWTKPSETIYISSNWSREKVKIIPLGF